MNAFRSVTAIDRIFESVGDIVRDVEVEVAVTLDVSKSGARAKPRVRDPRSLRHVGEGAIAVVTVQAVFSKARDVDIEIAIVVIVGDHAPHGVTRLRQARLRGNVDEAPAVVSIKSITQGLRPFVCGKRCSVQKIDVEVTVAIVVPKARPTSYRFHDVLVASAAVAVLEGDARLFGKIHEPGAVVPADRGSEHGCQHQQGPSDLAAHLAANGWSY